jgi:hypothetical protein
VGDVVDADQDHSEVGLCRQRAADLAEQVGRAGSHEGVGPQMHAAVGLLGDATGQEGAGGLDDPLDAVARGRGVAEQRDLDRGAPPPPAVPAGRIGRLARRLTDRPARELGLGTQQAVETRTEH